MRSMLGLKIININSGHPAGNKTKVLTINVHKNCLNNGKVLPLVCSNTTVFIPCYEISGLFFFVFFLIRFLGRTG